MPEETQQTAELTTLDHFAPFRAQAEEWMSRAKEIVVTDASQVDLIEGARTARLALRRIRIEVENTRKELKDEYLRKGNAIQSVANELKELIEPIEAHLQDQEDFVEVQEVKRKKELFDRRLLVLKEYLSDKDARAMPLDIMSESAFDSMIAGYNLARLEGDRKRLEELEQIEKRKLDDDRIRKENEMLKKQNEIFTKRIGILMDLGANHFRLNDSVNGFIVESLVGDAKAIVSEQNIKTISDAEFSEVVYSFKTIVEHNKDVKQKQWEKEQKQKQATEDKLKKERAERKRLEDLETARSQKEESERKAKAAEERKMKRSPDKDKLLKFADELDVLNLKWFHVAMVDEDSKRLHDDALGLVQKTTKYIRDNFKP